MPYTLLFSDAVGGWQSWDIYMIEDMILNSFLHCLCSTLPGLGQSLERNSRTCDRTVVHRLNYTCKRTWRIRFVCSKAPSTERQKTQQYNNLHAINFHTSFS